jgi:KDO2-lipid IV(A) lauroyltransferase
MTVILYYLAFALLWLFSLIPYRIMYMISDMLYFIIFYGVKYRRKVVFKNLHKAFPDKSEVEITGIAKAFYRHFSDFLLEITKCIRVPADTLNKRMKLINPEIFDELALQNKNFALVSAHYNNWEMMSHLSLAMKHRCIIIYRPLKNKISDRISFYMRSRFGIIMLPMDNVFRESLKYYNEKKLFSVWFLADQRPPRNSKFWTIFLNQETAFFEGAEKISAKLGMAVVFIDIQKVRRGFYEVRFEKIIENATSLQANEVTLTCVRKMEEEIVRTPAFWLWSHKRFKHTRPEGTKLITA